LKSDFACAAACVLAWSPEILSTTTMAPAIDSTTIPAAAAIRTKGVVLIATLRGSPDGLSHHRLVLRDISHFDQFASALGEPCAIGLDPMRFHQPVHEIEQAADGDGGMQGSLVPASGKHRGGVGLRHARWRQRQLPHEGENRPKLAVDGSAREVVDQTVD